MEKEYAASFFYAPYCKTVSKPDRNNGHHTMKFQLSAFTSVSPFYENVKGGTYDNMISLVLVLHQIQITKLLRIF